MANRPKIGVIGDGGWGTTLAILLSRKGFDVTLWGAFPDYVETVRKGRENVRFLPGVRLPDALQVTGSLREALSASGMVVLAVPSQYLRGVLAMLKREEYRDKLYVSVTKGIENTTLRRMSEVIAELLGPIRLAVLSGPTIALEVVNNAPTTVVAAAADPVLGREVQETFLTDRFRVYLSDDVIGVELGGALKNVIAIAAGALDALGSGTNAKAALLTRGLVEIARLAQAMGARRETIYGLSGLGDLATTCISRHSRNRWLGEEIGRGKALAAVLKETAMVVEGIATARSAYDLARKHRVEMPITAEVYRVLYEGKDPKSAVHDLMTRSPKAEGG